MRYSIGLVSIALMFLSVLSSAKIPSTSLNDLVRESDRILIGQVAEIRDGGISKEYGVPFKLALIKTKGNVKGSPKPEVAIQFHPTISEEPSFAVGKEYLLFLKSTADGVRVAVGYLGAREVIEAQVRTDEIAGESSVQPLKSVLARIRAIDGR